MGLPIVLEKEDEEQSVPYDHELNPIAFALRRAFQLNPDQQPQVFNFTAILGVTEFKLSKKVQNWVQDWDFEHSHKEFEYRGIVIQFNIFDKEPNKKLIIDFATRTISFEGE